MAFRIRDTKKNNVKVVDVDGSYLYRKRQLLAIHGGDIIPSSVPLSGWEVINEMNRKDMAKRIHTITHGKYHYDILNSDLIHESGLMYTYLTSGPGHIGKDGAFRSLERGYNLWSSGRLTHLELNSCHPLFCHIRCKMTRSMKQSLYGVYILLRNNAGLGKVEVASCGCAAEYVLL